MWRRVLMTLDLGTRIICYLRELRKKGGGKVKMTNIPFGWVDKAQTVLNTSCLSRVRSLPHAGPLEGRETTICLFDGNRMDWNIGRGHF